MWPSGCARAHRSTSRLIAFGISRPSAGFRDRRCRAGRASRDRCSVQIVAVGFRAQNVLAIENDARVIVRYPSADFASAFSIDARCVSCPGYFARWRSSARMKSMGLDPASANARAQLELFLLSGGLVCATSGGAGGGAPARAAPRTIASRGRLHFAARILSARAAARDHAPCADSFRSSPHDRAAEGTARSATSRF